MIQPSELFRSFCTRPHYHIIMSVHLYLLLSAHFARAHCFLFCRPVPLDHWNTSHCSLPPQLSSSHCCLFLHSTKSHWTNPLLLLFYYVLIIIIINYVTYQVFYWIYLTKANYQNSLAWSQFKHRGGLIFFLYLYVFW